MRVAPCPLVVVVYASYVDENYPKMFESCQAIASDVTSARLIECSQRFVRKGARRSFVEIAQGMQAERTDSTKDEDIVHLLSRETSNSPLLVAVVVHDIDPPIAGVVADDVGSVDGRTGREQRARMSAKASAVMS